MEILALGLRWLKVIFASSCCCCCCCCCCCVAGGGGGSSRGCTPGGEALRPSPQPTSSFEISMTFFGFVFVVFSCCLL